MIDSGLRKNERRIKRLGRTRLVITIILQA